MLQLFLGSGGVLTRRHGPGLQKSGKNQNPLRNNPRNLGICSPHLFEISIAIVKHELIESGESLFKRDRLAFPKLDPFFDSSCSMHRAQHGIAIVPVSEIQRVVFTTQNNVSQCIPPSQYILRIVTDIQMAQQRILGVIPIRQNLLRLLDPSRLARQDALQLLAHGPVAEVANPEQLFPIDRGGRLCVFGMDLVLGAPVVEIGLAVVPPEEGLGEVVEFAADLLQRRY